MKALIRNKLYGKYFLHKSLAGMEIDEAWSLYLMFIALCFSYKDKARGSVGGGIGHFHFIVARNHTL